MRDSFQADLAFHGITDDRRVEQCVAFLLGGFLQRVEKIHDEVSSLSAGRSWV